ncbi:MAG: prepilin-type N-terminal cleavage/methylation domain-containing protein [Nitrospiraceae bacterium]|nr:MAG: prepilin-type N-terminal cleavage/methylation domain-containing protein [Nitrospiraceae bacterium]
MNNSRFKIQDSKSDNITNLKSSCPLHPASKGFTLLELMISITILGVIVLIVSSAMKVSFRSVSAGEKKMESLERVRASLKIVDSQIQSSIPLTYLTGSDLKYYFSGHKRSLRLSTNYSLWNENRGYVVVAYRIVSDDHGKKSLYASENIVGVKGEKEVKLLDGLDEIYFEYFYTDPTKTEGAWIEEWKFFNFPEKIRLNIVDGTKRFTLVMPLRVRSLGL